MSYTTAMDAASGADNLNGRIRVAVIASALINLVVWNAVASIARRPVTTTPPMVEITRVTIDHAGHKTVRVITPHMIRHKIQQVHHEMVKPKPAPAAITHPQSHPQHQPAPLPSPGAHTRVLLAQNNKNTPPPSPEDHTALPDGNADAGKPIDTQAPGDAKVNPPAPPEKAPDTQPAPASPPKVSEPHPPPIVDPAPQPAIPPPAPAKPKPVGPTRDAQPGNQVQPEIPDELKAGDYKSYVRVRVEISADGTFTPILRTSSGNAEIDKRVLDALKKWKWQPALQSGQPVDSVQLFKFEFEVN